MRVIPRWIGITVALAVFVLLFSGFWLDSDRYQALSSGVQAVGVLVALALGVSTLRADNKDRRVDRVIEYQSKISGGELQLARQRLIAYMIKRSTDGKIEVVPWGDIPSFSRSADYSEVGVSPVADAQRLLEYFEGVWGAHKAGATQDRLLFELLGGYVTWWDRALAGFDMDLSRSLHEFAAWIYREAAYTPEDPRVVDWQQSVARDFRTGSVGI